MSKNKIIAVYKIVNTATGDFYIGSSVDVKRRWAEHKKPSRWTRYSNNKMYQYMREYGLGCFSLEILEEVEPENLKQVEQGFIDTLKPTYNNYNAKGLNVERRKARRQSEKGKEANRRQARKDMRKYRNQLCEYNGETLTLNALSFRFHKVGISHPVLEAKKYLINEEQI